MTWKRRKLRLNYGIVIRHKVIEAKLSLVGVAFVAVEE
jgi:hypothetical protein